MDPYEPPAETPPPANKPLRYRPRFGPPLWAMGLGLLAFVFACVVSIRQGTFRESILTNVLVSVIAMFAITAFTWPRANRKD